MKLSRRSHSFLIIPTAAALCWTAVEATVPYKNEISISRTADTSGAQLSLRTPATLATASIVALPAEEANTDAMAPTLPLKFMLVSTTSVIAFAVSLIATAATFAPPARAFAADIGLVAMLAATTLGTWAASLAQRPAR